MKQNSITYYSILCAVAVLCILGVGNLIQIVTAFSSLSEKSILEEKDLKLKGFELVNRALKTKTRPYTFTFEGSFDSPFRKTSGVKRRKAGRVAKPRAVVKKLFLKGTLIKENALAIIEDEDGKTFICKQGDRVHNRLIASIGEDMVTVRDNGKSTILKVKDR